MSLKPVLSSFVALTFASVAAFSQAPPATSAASAAAAKPALEDGTYARINITQGTMNLGDIVVKMLEKESPKSTAWFEGLAAGTKTFTDPKLGKPARRKLYDGLTFHRVIPQFMIQGGDPLGNGTGGVGTAPDEYANGLAFDRPGRAAFANTGRPGSSSSQFFITEVPYRSLDGMYTIFGQVVEGQDIVAKVARLPRGGDDRPNTPVRMKITIERVGAAAAKPAVAPAKPATAPAKPAAAAPKPAAAKPATAPKAGTTK